MNLTRRQALQALVTTPLLLPAVAVALPPTTRRPPELTMQTISNNLKR
jgi:hypothetical protein